MSPTLRKSLSVTCCALCIVLAAACGPVAPNTVFLGHGTGPASLGISGDSLNELATDASRWSPPSQADRLCAGPGCPAGGKVRVLLFAANDAKDRGPSTGTGNVLIGKMINTGSARTRMYGLEPGPYHYLVYVVPGGTADTGRFIIEQVENSPPHAHRTVAHGLQIGCNHAGPPWTHSFALFRSCAAGRPTAPATLRAPGSRSERETGRGLKMAGMLGFLNLLQTSPTKEDPSWYTCTSGCCTSGAPQ